MIIDLLNFSRYYPGTEANILFRLQEKGISVPSFFCITKDFTEDELNNYLQNHYQQTELFIMRVSLSFEDHENHDLTYPHMKPPYSMNVPKSALEYTAKKLFDQTKEFMNSNIPLPVQSGHGNITVHIIIQEHISSDIFGNLYTACYNGPINETIIYTAHPDNADYRNNDDSYCVYCHNDTDGILFGHEPEGAEKADPSLIKKLLKISESIKYIFNNITVNIKFAANRTEKKIYIVSVAKIDGLKISDDKKIVLDNIGISNYYPGVVTPLYASSAMIVSRNIILNMIEHTGNYKDYPQNMTEINEYVNGRLYMNTNKLERLKKDLYLNTDMEEFIRPSLKKFVSQLKECGSISEWRKKNKTASRTIRILEENLRQRVDMRKKLEFALGELLAGSKSTPCDEIPKVFEKIILYQSECSYANYLNTLYIKFKQNSMLRMRPSDKKYKEIESAIAGAYLYRKDLRRYNYLFMKLLNVYGLRLGTEFSEKGLIEKPEDIFMLTLDELNIRKVENINILVHMRKREFEWYRSMPGFSKLIFFGKVQSAPLGKVDLIYTVKDESYIRGCGIIGGKAEYHAVVCKDNVIPEKPDSSKIYVMDKFTECCENIKVGGLIVSEQPTMSNVYPDIKKYDFPLICGAEHALDIICDDDIVSMDATTGEIFIRHIH